MYFIVAVSLAKLNSLTSWSDNSVTFRNVEKSLYMVIPAARLENSLLLKRRILLKCCLCTSPISWRAINIAIKLWKLCVNFLYSSAKSYIMFSETVLVFWSRLKILLRLLSNNFKIKCSRRAFIFYDHQQKMFVMLSYLERSSGLAWAKLFSKSTTCSVKTKTQNKQT